ncbi:DUF389 domain-containing protein [Acinetobacter sp. A3.8]|uniref:DUF389 domain-containing protein n=1 Tax=Acinetobacter sedimenti TaxID=2919922 RepID=A0A9X2B9K2_9GAMM|nr:DUF389 domain-containing protein [Acinetobacter sedimenti]MCJ8145675.1 DUF389 domain-containing protein [Acinetobacter sedimenti]
MATENEKDSPTIVVDEDHPEQEKYEVLKEKLRYKQAKRENAKKIDHKQVRLNIQADALPTKTFFIMNALAAVIAAYGLLADSAAVVIGAMLVAMMLGPISGVALSFIDSRWILFRTAMSTLLMGVAMIFAIGVVIGFIHHDMPMTSEILSRTQPTMIDLMIALAGGAAGAFASVSPRLSVAVVGVAVATALVPPLVASGILFAHFQWANSGNAFLLAVTNMVAIQISSSLVLWIAGFRRGSEEELQSNVLEFIKRNIWSLLVLVILAVYLSFNLTQRVRLQLYETSISQIVKNNLNDDNNIINAVVFDQKEDYTLVRVVIRGDHEPTQKQLAMLNQEMSKDNRGLPTKLQIRFIPVKILQTKGVEDVELSPRQAQHISMKTAE